MHLHAVEGRWVRVSQRAAAPGCHPPDIGRHAAGHCDPPARFFLAARRRRHHDAVTAIGRRHGRRSAAGARWDGAPAGRTAGEHEWHAAAAGSGCAPPRPPGAAVAATAVDAAAAVAALASATVKASEQTPPPPRRAATTRHETHRQLGPRWPHRWNPTHRGSRARLPADGAQRPAHSLPFIINPPSACQPCSLAMPPSTSSR